MPSVAESHWSKHVKVAGSHLFVNDQSNMPLVDLVGWGPGN